MKSHRWTRGSFLLACGCLGLAALASTGCQVSVGGQTLPSAYYHKDDVQFHAPGQENKLAKEAAALAAYKAEQSQRQQQQP